ncbi:hypothetical protein JAAARDRAFT_272835 [Jaapia argillacea MUCL 33604]|uniref:non-specific serine/threonine protein kinase n=1 Tax=Jaapia argillacea MUCL 33604 TaxID=933084 RepID=A0A067PV15_9AGAM|nr:hypothetical protein JAAARDRAFT_272835 [Jaapia argillacea MUCL 33604]
MLDKGHLQRHHKLQTALAEKNTLVRLGAGHPGIVRLHWAFHDEWCLYFVLDLARNGEMQTRISRMGSLSLPCARYYAAQIVDALDYMHSKGVIHRDLKPENLLLDDDFRIKITDFGTGKLLDSGDQRANSFVGTAQYVSPELLESSETSKSSDLWALACIVYQMIAGRFTFQGLSDYLTWQKIKRLEYSFPEGFDEQAKDLVQKILVRDPTQRLGAGPPGTANDMQALRSHPFFGSINWKTLWKDPAPKLEPGLIKKPPPPPGSVQHSPWDVDASWDNIVNGDGHRDEDEISWASDGDATEYQHSQSSHSHGVPNGNGYAYQHEDVGPMNEVRWPAAHVVDVPERQGDGDADTDGLGPHEALRERENEWERQRSLFGGRPLSSLPEPISVPSSDLAARDSYSTGSTTSSSDGSPIEKLSAALEAMMFDRGRNRAQTPIQGNGPAGEVDWSAILLPGESILFNSSVQPGSLRRRASRLLSMAVTPKVKTRQLVLTTHRLVCLKQLKGNRGLGVKSEFILRVPDEEGKKDTRSVVVSVEPKGEREFVVLTNHKSHSYIADTPSITSLWMEKIREAVKPTSPARETQASASRT